jgi:hypothetical protein
MFENPDDDVNVFGQISEECIEPHLAQEQLDGEFIKQEYIEDDMQDYHLTQEQLDGEYKQEYVKNDMQNHQQQEIPCEPNRFEMVNPQSNFPAISLPSPHDVFQSMNRQTRPMSPKQLPLSFFKDLAKPKSTVPRSTFAFGSSPSNFTNTYQQQQQQQSYHTTSPTQMSNVSSSLLLPLPVVEEAKKENVEEKAGKSKTTRKSRAKPKENVTDDRIIVTPFHSGKEPIGIIKTQVNYIPVTIWDRFIYAAKTIEAVKETREKNFDMALSTVHLQYIDKILDPKKLREQHDRSKTYIKQLHQEIIDDIEKATILVIQARSKANNLLLPLPLSNNDLLDGGNNNYEVKKQQQSTFLSYVSKKSKIIFEFLFVVWLGCAVYTMIHVAVTHKFPYIPGHSYLGGGNL